MAKKNRQTFKNKFKPIMITVILLTLAVLITVFCFVLKKGISSISQISSICEIAYPEMIQYPGDEYLYRDTQIYGQLVWAWDSSVRAQRSQAEGYGEGLEDFFAVLVPELLTADSSGNQVCSPVGAYVELAALTEISGKDSRERLLELLGSENVEKLQEQASAIWNGFYCDDGVSLSLIETDLEAGRKAALSQKVLFQGSWVRYFQEEDSYTGSFHGASGDIQCEYMYVKKPRACYYGQNFAAVNHDCAAAQRHGNIVWFILPDEGTSPYEVLKSEEFYKLIGMDNLLKWENQEYLECCLSVPEFKVEYEVNLQKALEELNITVNGTIGQNMALTFDGNGVYSDETGPSDLELYWGLYGTGDIEAMELVFDRPFIFVMTGPENLPLYVGVVNQP